MKIFKNLKLSWKMCFGFGSIIILIAVMTFVSLINLKKVGNLSHLMYTNSFQVSLKSIYIINEFTNVSNDLKSAMLENDIAKFEDSINSSANKVNNLIGEIKPIFLGDYQLIENFENALELSSSIRKEATELANSGNYTAGIEKLNSEYSPAFEKAKNIAESIHDSAIKKAAEFDTSSTHTANTAFYIIIALFILIVLISISVSIFTTKSVTSPIAELKGLANKIALGQLNIDINSEHKDEFGELTISLANIVNSFNDALTKINMSAEQVSNGSRQVAEGAQSLAEGATEQASVIQELVASVSEISDRVDKNAKHAQSAAELSENANSLVSSGNRQMEQVVDAMEIIHKSTNQIKSIIKTIEDIASQTKLLSLNATIEAARAGEIGAGFGVVASEIGKLAYESAKATKNTTELIQKCIEAAENGSVTVGKAVQSLNKITEGANEAVSSIKSIQESSDEQSESLKQVVKGVEQVATVMQSSSAISQQSAATSEELAGQAEVLKSLVGRFKLKEIDLNESNI